MPAASCPIQGCDYTTADVEATIVAALLNAHSVSHIPVAPLVPAPQQTVYRAERVKRPSIVPACSSVQWMDFLSRWQDYKEATGVDGREAVTQLLECCEEKLRSSLTQNAGGSLINLAENQVLEAIRHLAVCEENTTVARVTLHDMHQDRDESIRSFCARLRGQAAVCKYLANCPNCDTSVSYADAIIKDTLCRGLEDSETQLDLLGDRNQDMTLAETIKFVEAKEAAKRSAMRLRETHSSAAATQSTYKRAARPEQSRTSQKLCTYCGLHGHSSVSRQVRKNECPAYNHICRHCGIPNHADNMCRSRSGKGPKHARVSSGSEAQDSAFDTLCSTKKIRTNRRHRKSKAVTLDHHLYDNISDEWKRQRSHPQPFVNLTITVAQEDYSALGVRLTIRPKTLRVPCMADTGCQSCLAGFETVRRLGFEKRDLIPVTLKMHAANRKGINILGAVVLRFTAPRLDGQTVTTRQITYVTDEADKLFLSREACARLGIITNSFPAVGEARDFETAPVMIAGTTQVTNDNNDSGLATECDCPRRCVPPPLPTRLPYPATKDNRGKLQEYLLKYYKSSTFNTCEHQPLPMMEGPPLQLMVDPNAKPVAVHTPVPVPIHWREDVKKGLDRDVRLGVIEPVPVGEPVKWCHRMVICAKKNGKPRRTVDMQPLNAHATRETHHTQSPFHQARSVPISTVKTVCDAWNGYHSIPLREEDKHLTTFITPWGRYRYRTAPQGYIASGDGYSRRFDEIVADIPNKTKCIDDTILWADNIEESFFQACNWLDVCGRHGITLNPEKFVFGQDTVEFAGFEITPDSVRPCQKFLQAIQDFPTPKNITDIRSWFGLINQVAYAFSMTKRMLPFRSFLKAGETFHWDDSMEKLLTESKQAIISEIEEGVRIFDKEKPTCLATDWSKTGIGFWLFQKHCDCPKTVLFCCPSGWKITLAGSRFTHPAESRYAPVEGEALAVADALDKARYFVLGCHDLTITVDHKPLLKLFTDRSLDDIPNCRLRNPKEKTLRYRFRMNHIPGVKHRATDSISRHPTGDTHPTKMLLTDDISSVVSSPAIHCNPLLEGIRCDEPYQSSNDSESLIYAMTSLDSLQCVTWDRVRLETTSDQNMSRLVDAIESGMPEFRHELPEPLREYHQFREHLSTIDGVAIYKDRIVIPPTLRKDCLTALHAAHQGVSSMTARAKASIFWPGITPAISSLRDRCRHCNQMAPSQPSAPPTPLVSPAYPFQCVCADFFTYKGVTYTVVVDRYSNWPIVERSNNGATGLITCLRNTFVTYGIPDELSSDGGPEFTASATKDFLQTWGVHHRLSSVAFPHSNCRAEVGVKTVKRMITDNTGPNGEIDVDSFQRAMLQYRNCPDQDTKLSPAMCVFGRPVKDLIPILPGRYEPHGTWQEALRDREEALRNRHMKAAERWSEHTKRLPPLKVGDQVRIQNQSGRSPLKWDKTGSVVEVRQHDQYTIRVDGAGRITLRNRKYLRKYVPVIQKTSRLTIENDITGGPHQPRDAWRHQEYMTPAALPPAMTVHEPGLVHDTPDIDPIPSSQGTPAPDTPDVDPSPSLQGIPEPNSHDEPPIQGTPTFTARPSRNRKPPAWQTSGEYDMTFHIFN